MNEVQHRIEELRAQILEHNRRYYVDNAPSISDYDFDMLLKELDSLEKEHPEYASEDSPTQSVGSDLSAAASREFVRRAHRYPMLSLGNTYSISEVEDFAARAAKSLQSGFSYCCELKFDGTAICLTYENGVLVGALTRGDGAYGDDVLENVRRIGCIPSQLKGYGWPSSFEIRGEIYMPYSAFDRLCLERERDGEAPFANPRNAASGSLKLTDPSEVERRGLECTLYHMLGDDLPYSTHDECLRAAASWGLPVSAHRCVCKDISGIDGFINYWDTERKKLPFATDGVVVKINELDIQRQLGFTSKFPRWAVAYKFKAEQACTEVLSIDFQVGRTGAVTPVANLSPVPLAGTVVKRATLHNQEQMRLLDIRIGDWVYVEKGGEIIPKITAVELSKRPAGAESPEFPKTCPDCGAELVRAEGEAKWFCPDIWGCPKQAKERLIQFLSRKAMNVLGVGDAAVEQMYDNGLVRMPSDFYSLKYTDLYRLEGWKEKSCQNFLDSLKASLDVSFEHVLFAMGIRGVGETTAKALARHWGDIDALMAASREDLMQQGDIGEVTADSIIAYFADPKNIENIERLRKAGLQFCVATASEDADRVLEGKTFVITGTYSISREAMKDLVEKHGGKVSGSVSARTSYVIAGNAPGPEKIRKAESLGVRAIDENEFYEMCGEASSSQAVELTLF